MSTSFRLATEAEEIVDAVRNILGTTVILFEVKARVAHARMSNWWSSRPHERMDDTGAGHWIDIPINGRWSLWVAGRGVLTPGARELASWTARKLRPYFEGSAAPRPSIPIDGGTSDGAEAGVPVWRTRKPRN